MTEFETLLNQPYNDDPNFWPFNWEREWWGDKVVQYNNENSVMTTARRKFTPMTRAERRRRNRVYSKHLKFLSDNAWFPSGAYEVEDKNGNKRIKRYWRGQRSKSIKKKCNRMLRRSNKLNTLTGSNRGWYRRATEFWWEYD